MKSQFSYSHKKFVFLYVCWWLFWSMVQGFVLHRLELSWRTAFIDSFVSNFLLGALSLTAILLYRFYQPGPYNRVYRFVYALGITVLYCSLLSFILSKILHNESSYLIFLEKSMPIRFISALMILSFITLLNWLWNILQDQKEQEKRKAEAEQLIKDAELVKIRQQLQPHFLFNSLNSISALAGNRPEEARKMIQQLSDFLRGTLKKDEQKAVPLQEELEHLKLYLEIEKVRFGHRLNIDIQVPDEILNDLVPPLLLQPLVENAIKFGLYGTTENLTVEINAWKQNRELYIQVRNPFDATSQSSKGTGFGLDSVRRRLLLLYGRNDLLITESTSTVFTTTLKIPQ